MVSLPLIQHLTAAIGRLRGRRPIAWVGFVILASCVGLIARKVVDRHLASLKASHTYSTINMHSHFGPRTMIICPDRDTRRATVPSTATEPRTSKITSVRSAK